MRLALMQSVTCRNSGITLVEVMLSLAIASMLLAVLGALFVHSSRLYARQNAAAGLQQEIRTTLEIIVQASRMAGFQIKGSGDKAKIKVAEACNFRFQVDRNADGKLDDAYNHDGDCENLTFRFSSSNNAIQMICGEGTASMNTQVLIGGTTTKITAFNFGYFDENNNPSTSIENIRGVVVNIAAQAPAGKGDLVERHYITRTNFRNAAPNVLNHVR